MKIVYLVRHGKAAEQGSDTSDFDRILIEKGIEDAHAIASRCARFMIKPSLIISSPAPRSFDTARIFAEETGYPKKSVRTRKSMYDQTDSALLDEVVSLDDSLGDVMLVGHNPSIEVFSVFLLGNKKDSFPTGGFMGIACNVESWRDITAGCGKCIFFESPGKTIKKLTWKAVQKGIEANLSRAVTGVLSAIDPIAAEQAAKALSKSTDEIVSVFVKEHRKALKKAEKKRK